MAPAKLRDSVAKFYELHHKEGKKYTYDHFKNCGLSKSGIYYILERFDERGNVEQKSGGGRPKILSNQDKKKLFNDVNHKSYQIIKIVFFLTYVTFLSKLNW